MNSEQVGLESFMEAGEQICSPGACSTIAAPKQRKVVTLLCDLCLLLAMAVPAGQVR